MDEIHTPLEEASVNKTERERLSFEDADLEFRAYETVLKAFLDGHGDPEKTIQQMIEYEEDSERAMMVFNAQLRFVQNSLRSNEQRITNFAERDGITPDEFVKKFFLAEIKEKAQKNGLSLNQISPTFLTHADGVFELLLDDKTYALLFGEKSQAHYLAANPEGKTLGCVVYKGRRPDRRSREHELHHIVWKIGNDLEAEKADGEQAVFLVFQDEMIAYLLSDTNCDQMSDQSYLYSNANNLKYKEYKRFMGGYIRAMNDLQERGGILIPIIRRAQNFEEMIADCDEFVRTVYREKEISVPRYLSSYGPSSSGVRL